MLAGWQHLNSYFAVQPSCLFKGLLLRSLNPTKSSMVWLKSLLSHLLCSLVVYPLSPNFLSTKILLIVCLFFDQFFCFIGRVQPSTFRAFPKSCSYFQCMSIQLVQVLLLIFLNLLSHLLLKNVTLNNPYQLIYLHIIKNKFHYFNEIISTTGLLPSVGKMIFLRCFYLPLHFFQLIDLIFPVILLVVYANTFCLIFPLRLSR